MGGGQIQYKLFSILRFRQKLNRNINFSQEYIYIWDVVFWCVFEMLCYLWVLWTDIYRVSGLHRVRNWGPVFHEYLLTKWLKGVPNKISLNLEGFHEILHIFCCMILVRNHYQNSELKRPQCLNKPQVDQDMIHAFSLQSTSKKSCFCWVLFVPVSWGLVRVSHTHIIYVYIYIIHYIYIYVYCGHCIQCLIFFSFKSPHSGAFPIRMQGWIISQENRSNDIWGESRVTKYFCFKALCWCSAVRGCLVV